MRLNWQTAAYAIIADLDPENISFYLGITEISTGLGYMVGPALGGWLYSIGGFTMPFLVLGTLLLPTAAIIYFKVPPEMFRVRSRDPNTRTPAHPHPACVPGCAPRPRAPTRLPACPR